LPDGLASKRRHTHSFIVLEQLVQGLHLGHPVQTEFLKVTGSELTKPRLEPSSWLKPLGFCLAFGLFWTM